MALRSNADTVPNSYVKFNDEDFTRPGTDVGIVITNGSPSTFNWTTTADVTVDTIALYGISLTASSDATATGSEPIAKSLTSAGSVSPLSGGGSSPDNFWNVTSEHPSLQRTEHLPGSGVLTITPQSWAAPHLQVV
jgi:hypothetical protein